MLIPTVAIAKVKAPMIKTRVFGIFATSWTGSVIASPYTATEPAVTTTVTREKAVKLTGSPKKLPHLTIRSDGEKREKSQKFRSSVEKYATTRDAAVTNARSAPPAERSLEPRLKSMWPPDSITIHRASANMAT